MVTGHKKLQKLLNRVQALHDFYAKGSPEKMKPQRWCAKILNTMFNFTVSLFAGTSVVFMAIPLIIYFVTDKQILPFCMLLPFVDHTTLAGYYTNYLIQVIVLYNANLIECSFDMFMVIFIINSITFVDHFKIALDEFGEYLIREGRKDPREIKMKLREIHNSHLEIIE